MKSVRIEPVAMHTQPNQVDLEKERHSMTMESMADVDAGRVVDHQAVQAWGASLDTDEALPAPR